MALARVNGVPVLEARVQMPYSGAWTADLAIDAAAASVPTGRVVVDLGGPLSLRGVATRGGAAFGVTSLRVVGGSGGLAQVLEPKDYRGVPLRIPLQDAVSAAGETLAANADQQALALELDRWTRFRQRAAEVLDGLAAEAGCTWRVLYSGTVWLGADNFPAANLKYDLLRGDPHLGQVELGVDVPSLVPGVSLLGQQVRRVEHVVSEKSVRTVANFA